MPSEAGWGQPSLVTKGPNQIKWHHPSSCPKMTTGCLWEFFQPPRWEALFFTPGKECYDTCFQQLAHRLPQWNWKRQGWGFCCACSPKSTCSTHSKKPQLCREIPGKSGAFSPAGYISCLGLIKLLIKPPSAALWSQSSVSWALFRSHFWHLSWPMEFAKLFAFPGIPTCSSTGDATGL